MNQTMSVRVTRTVRLEHLLGVFRVGSGEWSWQEEYDELFSRPWQHTLTEKIRVEGIREPVLLGSDGRVWDGHHRICAAMHLGLDEVPVEWSGSANVPAERDAVVEHDREVAKNALLKASERWSTFDGVKREWHRPTDMEYPLSPAAVDAWIRRRAGEIAAGRNPDSDIAGDGR